MDNFDNNESQDMSVEQINELFNDIVEIPGPLIAGISIVANDGSCLPKGGTVWA